MQKFKNYLSFIITRGAFVYVIYLALFMGIGWAMNLTQFIIYALGVISLMAILPNNDKMKQMHKKDKFVSLRLSFLVNIAIMFTFAAMGYFVLASVFAVYIFVGCYIRSIVFGFGEERMQEAVLTSDRNMGIGGDTPGETEGEDE